MNVALTYQTWDSNPKTNTISNSSNVIDISHIFSNSTTQSIIPTCQQSIPKQKYTKQEGHIPVQPIKSLEHIQQAKQYFLNKFERYTGQNIRDYTIFVLGINMARRCGDLLHIRFHNVLDNQMNIKEYILISEQKTNKSAKILITPVMKEALELYLSTFDEINLSDPLFPSRNKNEDGSYKPMTVKNMYFKMKALEKELELNVPLGTHSLRKSWATQAYKKHPDKIGTISKSLNHSNVETTFKYLGIDQEEIDELFLDNQL